MFVPLRLHADGEFIGQNPVGKLFEREFFPDGREQDGAGDFVFGQFLFGPLVVGAVGDDEFEFVLFIEVPEVPVDILAFFAATGAFQIHDFHDAWIDAGDVERTAGFEEDMFTEVAKAGHEWQDVGLEQRFAAGDFDEGAIVFKHLDDHVTDSHRFAFVERIGRVAPSTAEVAGGEAHEDTG